MNSLSGISHLFVDISVLIFPLRTPTVDYHQLQPLSVNQGLEKTRKAKKKKKEKTHQKIDVFYLDTSAMDKNFLGLFHPSQNI